MRSPSQNGLCCSGTPEFMIVSAAEGLLRNSYEAICTIICLNLDGIGIDLSLKR